MDGLNTVLEYLTSVPAWYLATSVDGQPHVRPFSFAQIQDGKLWFVTARTKDVSGRPGFERNARSRVEASRAPGRAL